MRREGREGVTRVANETARSTEGSSPDLAEHKSSLDEDRVAEVYFGTHGGKAQQAKTRERIDWMLAQQKGLSALDLGCSQGILSLLLARKGIEVLAVDINPKSLEYAADLVGHEPEKVIERIQFLLADVTEASLPNQSFDTVYVGEVIEHLETPEVMIKVATDHLADSGRLVVTTPHGFLPHEDHKQAFGLSAVMALLPPAMSVGEIDIRDGYIRIIGETDGRGLRPSTEHLLALTERSLVQQQTLLHRYLRNRGKALSQSQALVAKLENDLEDLKNKERSLVQQQTLLNRHLRTRDKALSQSKTLAAGLEKELNNHKKALKSSVNQLKRIQASSSYKAGRALSMAASAPITHGPRLAYRALRFALARVRRSLQLTLAEKKKSSFAPLIVHKPDYEQFKPLKKKVETRLPVVAIMDEFTASCFRYEWDITLLSRKGWQQEIERINPAFLFVESAWRGNGGAWNYTLTKFDKEASHPLYALVMYCRSIGVPTVYWGKEDPPNFDVFKEAASIFDVLFTSDEDCVPRYREICGHSRVYPLPFAAQPILHNPATRNERADRQVAFAGGWYNDKHPARHRYLPELLDGTLAAGLNLTIFDRFSDLRGQARAKHEFPARFAKFLRPKLPYQSMLSAYRSFPTFLNVNSVETSPTMFSRRVFELLACGTNVVSSPSVGMNRMLPDLVLVASSAAEATSTLNMLHSDPEAARRRAHIGYRAVMREHTYARRAAEVVNRVVPNLSEMMDEPLVTVILVTNRPKRLAHALESYRRQRYGNKKLILALNSDAFDRATVESVTADIPGVKIFHIPQAKTLASCMNHVVKYADGRYLAKFDDDDVYGAEYLGDALLPFKYTDAAVVGKKAYFAQIAEDPALYLRFPGQEHRYSNHVCGGTLVVDREATRDIQFEESIVKGADTRFLNQVRKAGLKIYSSDIYNFVQIRQINPTTHTWDISREEYLEQCRKVSSVRNDRLVLF